MSLPTLWCTYDARCTKTVMSDDPVKIVDIHIDERGRALDPYGIPWSDHD